MPSQESPTSSHFCLCLPSQCWNSSPYIPWLLGFLPSAGRQYQDLMDAENDFQPEISTLDLAKFLFLMITCIDILYSTADFAT